MAIVMTKKFDDCTVYIDDEYSRNTSPEEKQAIIKRVQQIIMADIMHRLEAGEDLEAKGIIERRKKGSTQWNTSSKSSSPSLPPEPSQQS